MENTLENEPKMAPVLRIKDWIIIMIITAIPIVNLIMLFVWAFDKQENPNKVNWAKANLLILAVVLAFFILMFIAMASLGFMLFNKIQA